ncbi:MAG TPA: DUF3592 domain-containing protein [Pyrinomonadaceae bacterium]|nr:DUF3592 domain-containing protein [Pyrinomonadaceae bacterium]
MLIFIGLLFILIGFAVVVSGIFATLKVRRQIAGSAKATGKVVGFGRIQGQRGYLYCPQVEFQIPNGQTIKFQSEVGSQPPAYNIGQQVEVVYQTANPSKAEIDSMTALWFAPGCLSLMGLVFLLLGIVLFGFGVLIQIKS